MTLSHPTKSGLYLFDTVVAHILRQSDYICDFSYSFIIITYNIRFNWLQIRYRNWYIVCESQSDFHIRLFAMFFGVLYYLLFNSQFDRLAACVCVTFLRLKEKLRSKWCNKNKLHLMFLLMGHLNLISSIMDNKGRYKSSENCVEPHSFPRSKMTDTHLNCTY